jgi:outer membrane receptor protein involved in Fe transport
VAIPQNNIFLWSMLNYGKVKIEGMDFKLYVKTFLFNKINVDFKLNYSYQKAVDNEKTSLTYKEVLPYMPKNIFSSILTVDYKNITLGYTAFFVDKRYALSENVEANELSAYSEHNINLSYNLKMNNKKYISNVNFMLSLNNIFNTQYEVVKSYPMIGRNIDFKIKISL